MHSWFSLAPISSQGGKAYKAMEKLHLWILKRIMLITLIIIVIIMELQAAVYSPEPTEGQYK